MLNLPSLYLVGDLVASQLGPGLVGLLAPGTLGFRLPALLTSHWPLVLDPQEHPQYV